jgi:hypothetical protein
MQTIPQYDWQKMPEEAQREVYDFFLFIKQRYSKSDESELQALSNHSANLVVEWLDDEEDEVWK